MAAIIRKTEAGQAELIIGDRSDARIYLQERGFSIEGYEFNRLVETVLSARLPDRELQT